jgi:hypothetical protein
MFKGRNKLDNEKVFAQGLTSHSQRYIYFANDPKGTFTSTRMDDTRGSKHDVYE